MSAVIASVDWGFVGVVVAIAGIVIASVISLVLYLLGGRGQKHTTVSVEAQVDASGMVHALIKKSGQPVVHVRDVKVLRTGTNENVQIISRYPVGDFDIAGSTAKDCYLSIDAHTVAYDIDVEVWTDATSQHGVTAKRAPDGVYIKVPAGVVLK